VCDFFLLLANHFIILTCVPLFFLLRSVDDAIITDTLVLFLSAGYDTCGHGRDFTCLRSVLIDVVVGGGDGYFVFFSSRFCLCACVHACVCKQMTYTRDRLVVTNLDSLLPSHSRASSFSSVFFTLSVFFRFFLRAPVV